MYIYIYTYNSYTAVAFFMKIIVWLDVYFNEHSHNAVSGIAYCVPNMDQLSCRDHPSYRVGCFVETVHFVDITGLVVIGYVVWISCLIEITPLTGIGCFVETICFMDISGQCSWPMALSDILIAEVSVKCGLQDASSTV